MLIAAFAASSALVAAWILLPSPELATDEPAPEASRRVRGFGAES